MAAIVSRVSQYRGERSGQALVRPMPVRPRLRVIEGGSGVRSQRGVPAPVYWRRRAAVLVVAVLAVALLFVVTRAAWAAPEGAGAGRPAPSLDAGGSYVVRSGETYWSIASGLAGPGDDVRVVVDALQAANGDAPLEVGQAIVLPD